MVTLSHCVILYATYAGIKSKLKSTVKAATLKQQILSKFYQQIKHTDALWNKADHYIFIVSFLLLISPSFFRLISAVADWMSAILAHMVWPCAYLGCSFETCCTWLAGNAGPKKIAIKSRSGHHRTTLSSYIFATKARIDDREKTC